ncbi:MAG: sodium:solute symporter family protein [Geodermatophilaceae bacterium]|nr:sodium:solute symporter family protein [Geodermatophilaceae bacterium]
MPVNEGPDGIQVTEATIFVALFLVVTVMGFLASRWRRPEDLLHLDEWGLGGRNFGSWVTWFLIGGDLYTAYTFVAVPALMFGAGAAGFFAVPYTVVIYPMVFLVLIRLWSVSHVRGFVTPADFVRSRFDSPTMALLVAITGIVATMPYIALQLIGIEAVLKAMGVEGELPIIVAFVILALYTYSSGLRAPALIAFVKDALIYLTIIVAIIVIPVKLGGWDVIFGAAEEKFSMGSGVLLPSTGQLQYATLAFGSALALFLYPHSITGVLASKNRDVIKRNMSALPAYSLVLGLIALLGFMAIAAGVQPIGTDNNTVVPVLFDQMFYDWFNGIAYAAIGIGALVPAAIMAIAAANLFTRNIYKEYIRKDATPRQEAQVAKVASLVVKLGAVAAILFIDPQFSIDLQLIGGVIILQTLPAVAVGLFTRWFHRAGLIAGWVAGMGSGVWLLYTVKRVDPVTGDVIREHFAGSAFSLSNLGIDTTYTIYAGFIAVLVNLLVTVLATVIFRRMRLPAGTDGTGIDDYFANEGDPRVKDLPEVVEGVGLRKE